jgi:hypothetical protein
MRHGRSNIWYKKPNGGHIYYPILDVDIMKTLEKGSKNKGVANS